MRDYVKTFPIFVKETCLKLGNAFPLKIVKVRGIVKSLKKRGVIIM